MHAELREPFRRFEKQADVRQDGEDSQEARLPLQRPTLTLRNNKSAQHEQQKEPQHDGPELLRISLVADEAG
jgi:hypothetical protein